MDWYHVAFVYGVEKFPNLVDGQASNLASILQIRYAWSSSDPVCIIREHAFGLWPGSSFTVTITTALVVLYGTALAACSAGAAHLFKHKHPRFLIAITTPWLLFFALMPRMHERYLLWAAGVGAVVVGTSLEAVLLVALVGAMSWLMTLHGMLAEQNPTFIGTSLDSNFGERFYHFIQGTYPDTGWVVLLCAAIFLYQSVKPVGRHWCVT